MKSGRYSTYISCVISILEFAEFQLCSCFLTNRFKSRRDSEKASWRIARKFGTQR